MDREVRWIEKYARSRSTAITKYGDHEVRRSRSTAITKYGLGRTLKYGIPHVAQAPAMRTAASLARRSRQGDRAVARQRRPYPLLVLLDGAAYVSNRFGNAPATLDNLINDGRIRPAIVLFDSGNRGGGPAGRASFGEAPVKEVLPMLRASYPISTNPADIVIGGFSGGGLAAAEIYPEVGGGHEWVHWRAMLADGLMTLVGTQPGQKR